MVITSPQQSLRTVTSHRMLTEEHTDIPDILCKNKKKFELRASKRKEIKKEKEEAIKSYSDKSLPHLQEDMSHKIFQEFVRRFEKLSNCSVQEALTKTMPEGFDARMLSMFTGTRYERIKKNIDVMMKRVKCEDDGMNGVLQYEKSTSNWAKMSMRDKQDVKRFLISVDDEMQSILETSGLRPMPKTEFHNVESLQSHDEVVEAVQIANDATEESNHNNMHDLYREAQWKWGTLHNDTSFD